MITHSLKKGADAQLKQSLDALSKKHEKEMKDISKASSPKPTSHHRQSTNNRPDILIYHT